MRGYIYGDINDPDDLPNYIYRHPQNVKGYEWQAIIPKVFKHNDLVWVGISLDYGTGTESFFFAYTRNIIIKSIVQDINDVYNEDSPPPDADDETYAEYVFNQLKSSNYAEFKFDNNLVVVMLKQMIIL